MSTTVFHSCGAQYFPSVLKNHFCIGLSNDLLKIISPYLSWGCLLFMKKKRKRSKNYGTFMTSSIENVVVIELK